MLLFKRKNPYEVQARNVYSTVLNQTRQMFFYTHCGIPDTMDGRYDCLMLNVFLVIHSMLKRSPETAEEFNQTLFDVMFADMDQSLREIGMGDMTVPKHMRRMMKAFNGRMHHYEETIEERKSFKEVLKKNVYNSKSPPEEEELVQLVQYVYAVMDHLKALPVEQILEEGVITFPPMNLASAPSNENNK